MLRSVLRSKIHRATVTDARVEYEGSITIDRDLMDAARLVQFEKVLVANTANGARVETYVMEGERGTGIICMNGAAAHHAKIGDRLIIMAFCLVDEKELAAHRPVLIKVNEKNKIVGPARA